MVAMTDGSKYCRSCGIPKPVGEFRRRARDGEARLNQCGSCHRESERCRRAVKRVKRDGKAIARFATGVTRARGVEVVARLAGELCGRFGGLDGIVEATYSHYLAAPVGSPSRTRILRAILHLIELNSPGSNPGNGPSTGQNADPPQSSEDEEYARYYNSCMRELMSEEELDESLNDRILNMIRKSPELVIEVAKEWGWTVTPTANGQ